MVFHWLYCYLTFESLNKIIKTWVLCEANSSKYTILFITLSINEEVGACVRTGSPKCLCHSMCLCYWLGVICHRLSVTLNLLLICVS